MGTAAFDRLWDTPAPTKGDALDAIWDATHVDAATKLHAEYKKGLLGGRMQRENANDMEQAQVEDAAAPVSYGEGAKALLHDPGQIPAAAGKAFVATGANVARGIPGATAAEAGVRSYAKGQPYREALSDVEGATDKIPDYLRGGERIAGAAPLAGVLPGGPALSGAIAGGAGQLLDANPDTSPGERAARTVAGAVGGAALGRGSELATTGVRALAATPVAKKLADMQGARAAKAAVTYAAALLQGKGRTGTPQVQQWLASPDIHEIATELGTTREFAGVPHDDPRMLDAIYKVLSDRAQVVDKGLQAVTPNRPNIGRFQQRDIAAAQEEGLDAMSGGTSLPGPMPAYRKAVGDYSTDSRNIDALELGNDAVANRLGTAMTRGRNLDRTTPEALQGWARSATQGERDAATEGALGGVKTLGTTHFGRVLGLPLIPQASKALRVAPDVLRNIDPARQGIIDAITKAGLLGANAELQ